MKTSHENKIVVLTGSFNPPTIAHLKLLQSGMNALGAEKGLFVPASYKYVHQKLSKSHHSEEALYTDTRVLLLKSLAKEDTRISVDLSEAESKENVCTYFTLNAIAQKYPDAELYFLTGSDKLSIIPRWRAVKEFLETYHILVACRAGEDAQAVIDANPFLSRYREMFHIFEIDDSMSDVSSTALRELLRADDPAAEKLMTPETYKIVKEVWKSRIDCFREEYLFLSNFYPCEVPYNGITYQNAESAFQAQKCLNEEERLPFAEMHPAKAKNIGRHVTLRPDWEDVKIDLMEEIVRAKFTQNPELAEKLLATGDALLVEGNKWGDTCWGVDVRTGRGQNHLGKILMKVRKELQSA